MTRARLGYDTVSSRGRPKRFSATRHVCTTHPAPKVPCCPAQRSLYTLSALRCVWPSTVAEHYPPRVWSHIGHHVRPVQYRTPCPEEQRVQPQFQRCVASRRSVTPRVRSLARRRVSPSAGALLLVRSCTSCCFLHQAGRSIAFTQAADTRTHIHSHARAPFISSFPPCVGDKSTQATSRRRP